MSQHNSIVSYIENNMKSTYENIKENGEVFTPLNLVNRMLDSLPNQVWSNPSLKWLEPSCGIGNFVFVVYIRLMEGLKKCYLNEEERSCHILENMIYSVELSKHNIDKYVSIFGNIVSHTTKPHRKHNLNLFHGDFFNVKLPFDKFDIILGNPPYAKNLYKKFTDRCLKLYTQYIVFVIPSSFTVGVSHKKFIKGLKDNGLYRIEFLDRTYFEVDIDVLYFTSIKGYQSDLLINNVNTPRCLNITNHSCLEELNIFKTIQSRQTVELFRGNNETLNYNKPKENNNIKFNRSEVCNHKLLSRLQGGRGDQIYWIHTPKNTKKIDKLVFPRGTASYNSVNRLKDLSRDIVFSKYISSDIHISKGLMYVEVNGKEESDIIKWYLMRSKLIRWVFLKINKFSELTKGLFTYIPIIPFDGSIRTDKQVFDYLNLSKKQVDIINNSFTEEIYE